ncbi:hypothetical protein JTE90_022149 [Oedothorax gibbosus]|uniref:Uncharacterized protein n=1 Tax=Oedothorax gibbosus TaxID=931172 RepID=A0AAV6VU99_9ARAC|nr:hypothetical protein JTE90_022149 [Oedothorax gibbosus]
MPEKSRKCKSNLRDSLAAEKVRFVGRGPVQIGRKGRVNTTTPRPCAKTVIEALSSVRICVDTHRGWIWWDEVLVATG